MKVIETPISPFLQNAPIAYCEETRESIFIDPGDEIDKLLQSSSNYSLIPKYICLTHGHIDHAGAALKLSKELDLPIIGPHPNDKFLLDTLEIQGNMYGIEARVFSPSRWLNHNDVVTFGNEILRVSHCPGHTPGHVIFINDQSKIIIAGDVIFRGSIGRTDLPLGNHQDLINSIKNHVLSLEDDYLIYSGHGNKTNIGHERSTNPFLVDA
tara:strand:- start:243 stop:875 length:633 start_codon:yes stop_codon:yes gene_type:complete